MGGDSLEEVREELTLQLLEARFGAQNPGFHVLELARLEALTVSERLLANVVVRYERQVRRGDFEVVPEDLVVTDLERADTGALTLCALIVGHPATRTL